MNALQSIALSVTLVLMAGSASAFSLGELAQAASAMTGGGASSEGDRGAMANPQSLELINDLAALNVTPQQAIGGTGALLGLAQSQLAGGEYAQLTQSVPGLDQLAGNAGWSQLGVLSGLLGHAPMQSTAPALATPPTTIGSLADVNQAFSALGMDVGLVGQFTPILLQFLGSQGVAATLLQSLGGIWGVPAVQAPTTILSAPAPVDVGY